MRKTVLHIIFAISAILIISSCSTTKYLDDNQSLLIKNKIHVKSDRFKIETDEVKAYIQQRPNKKLFGLFRFKLWAYYKAINGRNSKFNRWVENSVGERPAIFDSVSARESAKDMELYFDNIGYFNADVTFSYNYKNKKKNKVIVDYQINPGEPYKIRKYNYSIDDPQIASYIFQDTAFSLIKRKQNYNSFNLDEERNRITEYLKNNGYYKFTKDYIFYEVDSALNDNKIDITLKIEDRLLPDPKNPGRFIKAKHNRYIINKIYINPNYNPISSKTIKYDTLIKEVHQIKSHRPANYYYILYKGKLKVKPQLLSQSVFIEDDEPFNLKDVQQTYRRFANLGAFNYTSIHFEDVVADTSSNSDIPKEINCFVNLSRAPLQAYTIEAEGTNSGGDLGIGGNVTYQNRNIFRGAETFSLRFKGGLEAQRISKSSDAEDKILFFNTYEYGVDANIVFPKFLIPIRQEKFPKYFKPKTILSTGLNFQNRPKYRRYISTVTFGYSWDESPTKKHIFNPAEINLVKIFPSAGFQQELDEINDERLKDQYTDHLIAGASYSFIFNNQDIRKVKNFMYFRGNLEVSGNFLNLIDRVIKAPKDSSGYYSLFGIRYAQYVRTDLDYRYYFMLNKENSVVTRIALGVGIPYGNSEVLPFEKGFYLGGANGMRGWRYRSLGPGGFKGEHSDIDKSGDIMIEGNLEYRFPIYKFFKGAIYTDIGNVWLLHENSSFSDAEFQFNSFISQLAVDAGVGFRFDFNFFIFRIDPAVKLRNPSNQQGNRWVIDKLQWRDVILNFGIGYPF